MANIDDTYEVLGLLTEDCQYIQVPHYKIYQRAFKKLLEKDLLITVQVLKSKRSDKQNRYMWSCIVKHARAWLYETQGEKFSPDYVYAWLRTAILEEAPVVKEIAGQEVITMSGKRFSQMTVQEFTEAVETIRSKMAQKGCIIPEPTKNNLLHEFILDE